VADQTRAPTINLGREVELQEPPSLFALAVSRTPGEQAAQGMAGDLAHGAAALRMCWPDKAAWPVLQRPRAWRIGQPVAEYGAEAWEGLRAGTRDTVAFGDLRDACYRALAFSLGSLLTQAEVDAARDFSEGQEE
jgi:hypothetical protein